MQRGTVRKDEFMNPVKITVSTKEPGLARDIARGLTELGKNLIIKIVDVEGIAEKTSQTDAEVLVTDFDEKIAAEAGFGPSEVVCIDEDVLQISVLYRQLMEIVCRKRDETNRTAWSAEGTGEAGSGRILAFFSRRGGCGVTSVTVTAGRMLAGQYGEKVLYIPLTHMDDSLLYEPDSKDPQSLPENLMGTVKELVYRLKNQRTVCMEQFVRRDVYGLEYLRTAGNESVLNGMDQKPLLQFLVRLSQAGGYDWIFLDLGKTSDSPMFAVPVELFCKKHRQGGITSVKEMAAPAVSAMPKINIVNQAERNHLDKTENLWNLEIQYDEESFLEGVLQAVSGGRNASETVEICMSKCFAEGVRKFTDELMDWAMSNRDEMW